MSGKQTAAAVGRQYERFTAAVARAVHMNSIAKSLLAQVHPKARPATAASLTQVRLDAIGRGLVEDHSSKVFPNAQHPTHGNADYVKEQGLGLRLRTALERAAQRADEVREAAVKVVEEVRDVMRMRG